MGIIKNKIKKLIFQKEKIFLCGLERKDIIGGENRCKKVVQIAKTLSQVKYRAPGK